MPSNALLGRSVLLLGLSFSGALGCALQFDSEGTGGAGGREASGGSPGASVGGSQGSGASANLVEPESVVCTDCVPLFEGCTIPDVTVEVVHDVRRNFRATRTYASAAYVNAAIRAQILPDPTRVIAEDIVNDLSRVVTEPTTIVRFTGEVDPESAFPIVKVESFAVADHSSGAVGAPNFAVVVDRTVRMAPVFALQEAAVSTIAERAGSVIVSAVGGVAESPVPYDAEKVKALFSAPQATGDMIDAATMALDALDKSSPAHLLVIVDGGTSMSGVAELAEKSGVTLNVLVLGQIDEKGEAAFDASALLALQPSVTTVGIFTGPGEDPGALVEAELGARFDEYFGVARVDPLVSWTLPDYFEEVPAVSDSEGPSRSMSAGFDRTLRRDASFRLNNKVDVGKLRDLCPALEIIKTSYQDKDSAWASDVMTASGFITSGTPLPPIAAYFDAVSLYARALRVPSQAAAACSATETLALGCANGKLDPTLCANLTTIRTNLDFIARTANTGSCPAQ